MQSHATLILLALVAAAVGTVMAQVLIVELRKRRYRLTEELLFPARQDAWLRWVLPPALALVVLAHGEVRPGFSGLAMAYVAVLAVVSVIDRDVRRLPDAITLPTAVVIAAAIVLLGAGSGDWSSVIRGLLAGPALAVGYLIVAIIGRGRGMGLGDVKLALSLGMMLGYLGWVQVLAGTVVSFLSASVVGVWAVLFRGAGRKTELPFGPYLAFGATLIIVSPAWSLLASR